MSIFETFCTTTTIFEVITLTALPAIAVICQATVAFLAWTRLLKDSTVKFFAKVFRVLSFIVACLALAGLGMFIGESWAYFTALILIAVFVLIAAIAGIRNRELIKEL